MSRMSPDGNIILKTRHTHAYKVNIFFPTFISTTTQQKLLIRRYAQIASEILNHMFVFDNWLVRKAIRVRTVLSQ